MQETSGAPDRAGTKAWLTARTLTQASIIFEPTPMEEILKLELSLNTNQQYFTTMFYRKIFSLKII